ncbi:MAG: metal-dependent hydrolase, partial [Telluria sp.]
MDNFSHSLAGLAAGELLHRSLTPEPDPQAHSLRRRMLLITCGLAANLPDLDLVLTRLLPGPLGYLLHHRGHTHTLLYSAPQALMLIALIWLLWPAARGLLRGSTSARAGLVLATIIGLTLHLLLDFLNSYGLHPFYPFDSRWLYGDMVFILEPVFWVGFGVPLAMMVPLRLLRFALFALLAGGLAWATASGFLHWASLLGLALGAAGIAFMQGRAGVAGRQGLAAGMLAAAAFVGLQGWASHLGKLQVAAHLQGIGASSRLLDTALTPFPANPVCWTFVSVERNDGARTYRVRRGMLSLAPRVLPLYACPAALSPALATASPAFGLEMESETSLATLRSLAANCHFRAWMRFARAPVRAGR